MPGYWHSMFLWGENKDYGQEWTAFGASFPKHQLPEMSDFHLIVPSG